MSYGLFFVWFVCDGWNLSLEMRSTTGRFRNFAGWVLHALLSFFSSHLSPGRLWPRPFNRTPLWPTWICASTTSAQMGQRRGVRWGWGRMGSWRGEGSRHRPMKVAVLNLRGAEYFSWQLIGVVKVGKPGLEWHPNHMISYRCCGSWNGLCLWVTLPNLAGSLRWYNRLIEMTSDRGNYWSDPAKNHLNTYFWNLLNQELIQKQFAVSIWGFEV